MATKNPTKTKSKSSKVISSLPDNVISNITITLDNEPPPLRLHHYTSAEGMLGIIKEDAIWATSIHHLNDAREFTHARELAIAAIREIEKDAAKTMKVLCPALKNYLNGVKGIYVYVACFSEVYDSLSQWRGYCPPGSGYSIGFMPELLKKVAASQGFQLIQCIYDRKQQLALAREWVNKTLDRLVKQYNGEQDNALSILVYKICKNFIDELVVLGAGLKHPSFADEKEWRLISLVPSTDGRTRLRAGKSMIVPYVPINLKSNKKQSVFWNICAGPTPHPDLAQSALTRLFQKIRIRNGVTNSTLPYRDW